MSVVSKVKGLVKQGLRPLLRGSAAPGLPPSQWELTAEPGRGLCLEGLSLHALLEEWGSPLHVVHGSKLAQNLDDFRRPRSGDVSCEVYYSCKTNPVPGVLRRLRELGAGIEVISPYELWLAEQAGFPPEMVIYNGPAKSEDSLRDAIERGILLINANHREEIPVLARLAREVGRKPAVGIRVTPSNGWSSQFGVPLAGGEAFRAYEEALATGVLDVVGLHAHVGLQITALEQVDALANEVLAFCDELHARLGITIRMLDLGGSLGIPSVGPITPRAQRLNRTFQRPVPAPDPAARLGIAAYAQRLCERVAAHFAGSGRPAPRLFVEPGRALTGNTQMLVASVLTTKQTAEGRSFAVLDAGMNLAESARYEYHQLFPVNKYGAPATHSYALAGPICTPADVLYPAVELPELVPGDSLVIMDAGAYFVPFATSFSFPQPAIVIVDDGEVELLRRAERFADLVALDHLEVPAGRT
jgi:diaminopimelate decarboxylase